MANKRKKSGSGGRRSTTPQKGPWAMTPTFTAMAGSDRLATSLFGEPITGGLLRDMGIPGGSTAEVSHDGMTLRISAAGGVLQDEARAYQMSVFDSGYGLRMRLENLHMKDSAPQGTGTESFRRLVGFGERVGLQEIQMEASGARYKDKGGVMRRNNGYYTFARLGADGPIPSKVKSALKTSPYAKAKTVQQVMHAPGGRAWWREHGDTFEARFDVRSGSASRQVLDGYRPGK